MLCTKDVNFITYFDKIYKVKNEMFFTLTNILESYLPIRTGNYDTHKLSFQDMLLKTLRSYLRKSCRSPELVSKIPLGRKIRIFKILYTNIIHESQARQLLKASKVDEKEEKVWDYLFCENMDPSSLVH